MRCYWRSGQITDGIDHLEYHVENSYLEQIILVDTPGTGTVIEEHENRTDEFLQLYSQLRERHDQETRQIGSKADAVIYLIGEVARMSDQAFLDEFQQVTQGQSRSLNAIGVLAKIDLNPEIIERREELARKITGQLQNSLNTVIPVSAGIQRALDDFLVEDKIDLKHLIATMRRIPPQTLDELLSDSELYLEMDCPVSLEERKQIRGEMLWKVFTTIARIAADPALDIATIIERLQDIAGFERLHDVLDQHFVKRGSLLRSYRIVNDALKVLKTTQFTCIPEFEKREAEDTDKRNAFLAFMQKYAKWPNKLCAVMA